MDWASYSSQGMCLPDLSRDRMQEEWDYCRETLRLPALRRDGTCCICARCSLRCLKDSPTQPSIASQNPCCAQRSECAFSQRQTNKGRGGWNTTSEILPHSHFHTAIVSTWWRNSMELKTPLQIVTLNENFPAKISDQVLFTLLNYQTKIFPGKDFCEDPEVHGCLPDTMRTTAWEISLLQKPLKHRL